MGLNYMDTGKDNQQQQSHYQPVKKQNGADTKDEDSSFQKKQPLDKGPKQTNRRGTIQIDDDGSDIVSDAIMNGEGDRVKKTGSFQEIISLNKNDLKS